MSTGQYTEETGGPRNTMATGIFVACRLVEKYRNRLPSIAELQSEFGMHRSTAFRWRAALAAARGLPNTGGIPRRKKGEKDNG